MPGIAEEMRRQSAAFTPKAMLSRAVAGISGRTLIVNLPGSPKAVQECMEVLRPALSHALELLGGGGGGVRPDLKPEPGQNRRKQIRICHPIRAAGLPGT